MSIILDVTKQRLLILDSRVMGEPHFWEGGLYGFVVCFDFGDFWGSNLELCG